MKLFIKNMISVRSINEVKAIFARFKLYPYYIESGQVEIREPLSEAMYEELSEVLKQNNYELILDKERALVEKIKVVIIEMIYFSENLPTIKYSDYISNKLKINYTYLSKFISSLKKITIEKFIITHKIERVKQMLLFQELSLSEIAWKLNYSSPAHLSAQFKKTTGLTPSLYKKSKARNANLKK